MSLFYGREQMRKKYIFGVISILIAAGLQSCSSSLAVPLFEYPPEMKDAAVRENIVKDYSAYLAGKKIFLDAGHGGEDRKNKDKNGIVTEADVNLRVVLNLKKYLEEAGAQVFLSREDDKTVDLGFRSELANNSGAEFFISIHHNAPGKSEDDFTDYTSTYYHAKDESYEYDPSNRDLARYIERDLAYAMRNSGGLGSFDGTYSDYIIYPGEGFSVLRKSKIPAVLVECAFHTSRFEILRLNNEEFNQIQAWGIFKGLAKYLRASKPEIKIVSDSLMDGNDNFVLEFDLHDSTGINPKSIQVFVDKREKEFTYDKVSGKVLLKTDALQPGEHLLKIVAANKNGNYSFPFRKKIIVSDDLSVRIAD